MKRIIINKPKLRIILIINIVCFIFILLFCFNRVNVGKIKDGKAVYSDKVANVTKLKDNIIIEFNNNHKYIDNCIMTTKIYNEFLNNKEDISLKKYINKELTAKESYNIYKSIDLKLVTYDTKYSDYFAVTCGFKNKKELLKYTEAVFKLAKRES